MKKHINERLIIIVLIITLLSGVSSVVAEPPNIRSEGVQQDVTTGSAILLEQGKGSLEDNTLTLLQQKHTTESAITFNDINLEKTVREKLGKKPNDEITILDMQEITSLYFYGSTPISDLTGLEHCASLKELTIVSASLLDNLEPIKDLPMLTNIMIIGANVNDISLLFQDTNKVYDSLSFSNVPIKDFSCLNGAKIKRLTISYTDLNFIPMLDETVLSDYGAILDLSDNKIDDISNLNIFTKIDKINLKGNPILDISPLLNLTNTKEVKIDYPDGSSHISGYIKDQLTNSPIENAVVEVEGIGAKVSTDYNGYFVMEIPSECNLLVSKPGYIPYQLNFNYLVNNPIYISLVDNSNAMDKEYTGKLLDYISGDPLENVKITVIETNQTTTTNNKGEFSLTLKEGVYNISFNKTNYKDENFRKIINNTSRDTIYLETDTEKTIVNITNSNLKSEIKRYLKPFGKATDDITTDHLALLKVFAARDCNASNEELEIIKHMISLEKLFIRENVDGRISDLSFLKNLSELNTLFIRGQHITDLDPLKGLTNLKGLAIMNHAGSAKGQLEDISVLKNLVNLKVLSLANNSIKDISSLENLDNLVRVDLSKNYIEDINPLKNVIKNINSGKDGDINDDTYNSDLELDFVFSPYFIPKTFNIILYDNRISDISPLGEMNELSLVDFIHNFVRDFGPVENVTNFNTENYIQKETKTYIYYKDRSFTDILPPEIIMNLPLGDTIINAKTIEGYTPIINSETITFDPTKDKGSSFGGQGIYQIEVMEDKVYFNYNEELKTGSIVIQYLDEDNKKIEDNTIQDNLPLGTHTLYSKIIDGYTLKDTSIKTATLSIDEEIITVSFRYEINKIIPPIEPPTEPPTPIEPPTEPPTPIEPPTEPPTPIEPPTEPPTPIEPPTEPPTPIEPPTEPPTPIEPPTEPPTPIEPPTEPPTPIEPPTEPPITPALAPKPVETPEPIEIPKPIETPEPIEIPKPIETPEPIEIPKPVETPEPIEPTKSTIPIVPLAMSGSFFLLLILLIMRKHVVVYSISQKDGEEILTKLSKKKVKITKDNAIIDLTKEKILADENPIRVVFLKNLSRRIGEKTVIFENENQPFFSFVFPVKLNKKHIVDVE